ncbi:MAG: hypothetical protein HKN21_17145 [Candidatus Eisenbacteria bacterium]|uniref:Uncharacterized protein n=1 Tax=Eiseniibacteriota bacterium TaxID=2212470 RepID=A0A7Y2EAZ4_UNCEI|nr:hypothetical protein [Candidatus Eisenbacteria bacterium]
MQEKHDKLARYHLDQEVEETAPVFDWDRQSEPWVESLMVFSRQIPEGLRLNRLSTVPPESREVEQILDDELMVFFDDEETVMNNAPLIFRIEGETESREALTIYMKALREISTDGVHLEWTRRPDEELLGTKAMSFGILIVIERNFVGEGI